MEKKNIPKIDQYLDMIKNYWKADPIKNKKVIKKIDKFYDNNYKEIDNELNDLDLLHKINRYKRILNYQDNSLGYLQKSEVDYNKAVDFFEKDPKKYKENKDKRNSNDILFSSFVTLIMQMALNQNLILSTLFSTSIISLLAARLAIVKLDNIEEKNIIKKIQDRRYFSESLTEAQKGFEEEIKIEEELQEKIEDEHNMGNNKSMEGFIVIEGLTKEEFEKHKEEIKEYLKQNGFFADFDFDIELEEDKEKVTEEEKEKEESNENENSKDNDEEELK